MRPLKVSLFPNAKALPLWACVEADLARRHGLALELHETGSSEEQRQALAAGRVQIVQSAVDNAVEMIASGVDVVIFMGGEGGMNDLVAQPAVRSISDLKGMTLAVDSPHTAYALLVRDLLAEQGLVLGRDYAFRAVGNGGRRLKALLQDPTLAAAILNPPFTSIALDKGLHVLASMDEVAGPYQAGGGFALRGWLNDNRDVVIGYMRSYLDGLSWMRSNRPASIDMLASRLDIPRSIATATLHKLCNPASGFEPNAKFSHEGFANVLRIRARANDGVPPIASERCFDETLYNIAINGHRYC